MTRAEITAAIGQKFRTFGAGSTGAENPIAEALKDRPLQFAAGVDVAEIVDFILAAAARHPQKSTITLDQKIACLKRELAMRARVYESYVARGRMTQEKANHELAVMQAILDDYQNIQA